MVISAPGVHRVEPRPEAEGAPPPWAAHTDRMRAAAPRASSTASSGANQAEAGGRLAGSDTFRPRSQRSHSSAPGPSRASPRWPRGTAKSTVIGPPCRWRAWIGKLAAPTTRRKIRAREYRSDARVGLPPPATAGSSQFGVIARRRPAGVSGRPSGSNCSQLSQSRTNTSGPRCRDHSTFLVDRSPWPARGLAVSNASSTRARAYTRPRRSGLTGSGKRQPVGDGPVSGVGGEVAQGGQPGGAVPVAEGKTARGPG